MLLRHDIVADRETETGSLAGRLCGEERLEELVLDLWRDNDAIVGHPNLDCIAEILRRHLQGRLELRFVSLLLALVGSIEAVAKQIEADPSMSWGTSSLGAIASAKSLSSVM
jgi:hypothetical protein